MSIRGLQTRLDKIELKSPRAVVYLFEPTETEVSAAVRQKALELGIPERSVEVQTYRWLAD